MLSYIIRRIIVLIPLLFIISIISYVIIELPPGDILTMRIMQLRKAGTMVGEAEIARLTQQYGLDKPMYIRYFKWIWNIIRYGNFTRRVK